MNKQKSILGPTSVGQIIGLVVFAALVIYGCTTVIPSTTETTPPALTWDIYDLDHGTRHTYTGNARFTPLMDGYYRVTLKADDPGGVKQITLGDTQEWDCSFIMKPHPIMHNGPITDPTDTQNITPLSDGTVLTSIFLIRDISVKNPCTKNPEFPFDCLNTKIAGTATNFSSKTAKATLSFFLWTGLAECRSL